MRPAELSAILLVLLLPVAVSGQQGSNGFSPSGATYLWPTDAGQYLSSTFAETRTAHFHSALDLKTWGRRGYRVYATRDGTLYRLATGPRGYGKVIYLKHEDGSYSVYAHLLSFRKSIQQLADSIRFEDYSFEIDRFLGHCGITFKQGDLIGFSGASGIGPPHLHFELRTPDHEPFNPLLTNLDVRDTIAPVFSALSVEPLAVGTTIEGTNRIHTVKARGSNGNYRFGRVSVKGPVGLGVNVFDRADEVNNAYAVYELKMFLEDSLLFHSRADKFSYATTGQMLIDRVYPILKETGTGYQRLYIAEGNTLPFYRTRDRSGKLNLPPGSYRIRMEASDFHGNNSSALLDLEVRKGSAKPRALDFGGPESGRPDDTLTVKSESGVLPESAPGPEELPDPAGWAWFKEWVTIPREEFEALTIAPAGNRPDRSIIYEYGDRMGVHLEPNREVFFRLSNRRHFGLRKISPGEPSYVASTTGKSHIRFEAGTFYDTTYAGLLVESFRPDSIRIEVIPAAQPVREEFRLAVAIDSLQQKVTGLGIYRYKERKQELDYLDTRSGGGYLIAELSETGLFFVLRDTAAPRLEHPELVRRPDNQWIITVNATDNLSGIDHTTAVGYVNGVRGIIEYEPEDDRLVYYHPEFVPEEGEHTLRISVRDNMNNLTEETFRIRK